LAEIVFHRDVAENDSASLALQAETCMDSSLQPSGSVLVPRRPWQFGIRTLLMVMLAVSVVIAFFQELKQTEARKQMRQRVAMLEPHFEANQTYYEVLRAIDLNRPGHRKAFDAIRHWHGPGLPITANTKCVAVADGTWELLHLSGQDTQWMTQDVLALRRDGKIIDLRGIPMTPREFCQELLLVSLPEDNAVEVRVIDHCLRHEDLPPSPGTRYFGGSWTYRITDASFPKQ
jgi:hypothetical protein